MSQFIDYTGKSHKIENYYLLKIEILKSGQERAYADSIGVYKITYKYKPPLMNNPEEKIRKVSKKMIEEITKLFIRDYKHEHHIVTSGFPYGLESFAVFKENEDGSWIVTIVDPYCD